MVGGVKIKTIFVLNEAKTFVLEDCTLCNTCMFQRWDHVLTFMSKLKCCFGTCAWSNKLLVFLFAHMLCRHLYLLSFRDVLLFQGLKGSAISNVLYTNKEICSHNFSPLHFQFHFKVLLPFNFTTFICLWIRGYGVPYDVLLFFIGCMVREQY